MWKLQILDDQGRETSVNLVREEYKIGRASENPIRLTERNVSRHHATILRTHSGFCLEDAKSYNGSFVNGVRVVRRQDVGHRDIIQLGDYRLEVIDEALDTQEQGFAPISPSGALPASGRLPHRLVVLIGPNQGSELSLDGDRFLIGRDDECEFTVDHASVSRIHAEVRKLDDDHFEIVDKGSANGLRINGHARPRAVLDGRDVIELGDVVFKYISKGQVFHVNEAEGKRIAVLSGTPLPPRSHKTRLGLGTTLAAAFAGALAVGGVLILVASTTVQRPNEAAIGPEDTLEQAVSIHQHGDVFQAHALLTSISPSSETRSTQEFIAIESAWAQAMIERASKEPDPARRRALLDQVSKTESVPPHQRQTALAAMRESEQAAVDLDDIEP